MNTTIAFGPIGADPHNIKDWVIVGGRRSGKSYRAKKAQLEAQRAEMEEATESPLTQKMLVDAIEEARNYSPRYDWAEMEARYRSRVLGHWEYTPQDELRDRLNRGLKKKDLGEPVNTRFWRFS